MSPYSPESDGSPDEAAGDPFDEHVSRWQEWCEAPWGRLRFAVVAHSLSRHLDPLAARRGRPLRVLDVGGGDARDSLPLAAAGHEVTVVDTAPRMLAEAVRRAGDAGVELGVVEGSIDDLSAFGEVDVVLCHFLLHYRDVGDGDVARLAGVLAPGGLLSVVAPNPAGRVLQRLVREGPVAALEEVESDAWSTVTFAHTGRQVTAAEVTGELVAAGLEVVGEHGGRIANDVLTDDAAKHDPTYFADLLRLELALADREPYKRVGGLWHLVAERPELAAPATRDPRAAARHRR